MRWQALVAVGLKGGAAASALLLQWLIARIYGPQGTGLFALMATTVTFIGVVAVLGQDYIVLRNVAGDLAEGKPMSARAQADGSLRLALAGTIGGTLALVAVAMAYGAGTRPEMMPILLLAAPVVAGLALGRVFAFCARAGGRVLSSQLPDGPITSAVSATLLLMAALVWSRPPTWTLGGVYGAAYLAALLFAWWLFRRVRADWPVGGSRVPARPLLVAGLPLVVANASPYFSDWLIIFTASSLFSAEIAGQIRIVTLVLSVMYLVFVAFDAILAPGIAAAIRLKDTARLHRLYWQYAFGSVAFNLPLILASLLVPERLLGLFGAEFVAAAPALRAVVGIQALSFLLGPAGTVLVMAGRERQVLWVNAAGIMVLFAGCALLIPAYGVMGGALSSALVLFAKRVTEVALVRAGPWRTP